jgi:GT2 family glycosyltransferase
VKILIGSPIRQDSRILKKFLDSLHLLDKTNHAVEFYFIDDNTEEKSSELLKQFTKKHPAMITLYRDDLIYEKNENTHKWTGSLIEKVIHLKNSIIQYCLDQGYDYLFFVDSDLILHPKTLKQLLKAQKPIVSEVFWTKWDGPNGLELPQVWMQDLYNFHIKTQAKNLEKDEIHRQALNFMDQMRIPGLYKVGGLGALTLIERKVFEAGVNFSLLPNISFFGEDRHFCIRAAAHGFDLYVDTAYPAKHLYRISDLDNA